MRHAVMGRQSAEVDLSLLAVDHRLGDDASLHWLADPAEQLPRSEGPKLGAGCRRQPHKQDDDDGADDCGPRRAVTGLQASGSSHCSARNWWCSTSRSTAESSRMSEWRASARTERRL